MKPLDPTAPLPREALGLEGEEAGAQTPEAPAEGGRPQAPGSGGARQHPVRKRPPRPRSSRLRASHCKECKADVPEPRHVLGIGEMCAECAPKYQVIGQLVEAIDGQICGSREDLFRAMVRAVQQLNFEYAVTGEGQKRKLQLGRARYRPAQMLQVYQLHRYQYEAIMREYLTPIAETKTERRKAEDKTSE